MPVTDGVSGQSGGSARRERKLCTGSPSSVFFAAAFRLAAGETLALVALVVVEQHRRERPAHVPFEIIGQHAEENMGAHARADPVMDRADLDVDGLQAAEGALDTSEALVGQHGPSPSSVSAGRLVRRT